MGAPDRRAELQRLENEAVDRLVIVHRQWWRPVRNSRLKREARELLAQAQTELDKLYKR